MSAYYYKVQQNLNSQEWKKKKKRSSFSGITEMKRQPFVLYKWHTLFTFPDVPSKIIWKEPEVRKSQSSLLRWNTGNRGCQCSQPTVTPTSPCSVSRDFIPGMSCKDVRCGVPQAGSALYKWLTAVAPSMDSWVTSGALLGFKGTQNWCVCKDRFFQDPASLLRFPKPFTKHLGMRKSFTVRGNWCKGLRDHQWIRLRK